MKEGLSPGDLLDNKYRIDIPLGRGGMGAVYRATHLGTKRTVAVKIIHPRLSSNDEFVERFRREAEAAGRLRHPNVVDVTDFGFATTPYGQVAYLVMEYLDGCTLAEVLDEEKRLPVDWTVDILEQVCSAVDEAHRLGIVHRDLKPDNIWLEPNRRGGYTVKVLDFGLAKLGIGVQGAPETARTSAGRPHNTLSSGAGMAAEAGAGFGLSGQEQATVVQTASLEQERSSIQVPEAGDRTMLFEPANPPDRLLDSPGKARATEGAETAIMNRAPTDPTGGIETGTAAGLTRVGSVIGTPLYMSPEQIRGEASDSRSDIYSLGVIAYRMLAGRTPFNGSLDELIKQHTSETPLAVRAENRKVPRRMSRLIMNALAKDPAARPETAAGFASALGAGSEGIGTLLRQAVSLYSEQFPTFLKISLLGYAPLILYLVGQCVCPDIIPYERFPASLQQCIGVTLGLIVPMMGHLLAYYIISSATVPIVVQLIVAPLRQVRILAAIAPLKHRWRTFLGTSAVVMLIILVLTALFLGPFIALPSPNSVFLIILEAAGAALFFIPVIVTVSFFALYPPVVVIERLGVRATLKRTHSLLKRSWITVLAITVLQFSIPILILIANKNLNIKISTHELGVGFTFTDSPRSLFPQLANLLVTPLNAIMTALLYLKTRRAGGETLRKAI
ncbi:MAG TPA: serine/threonine-protein kinase, partial [Blastocatellia bacterium]|nr:serine/threonine-protein kinase [Blastocatellia bacterium]